MEDLDSLLEDLGRGKSTTTAKKQRPPSSRVDLNELEDLMDDLAAPTSKQTPPPSQVVMPTFTTPSIKEEPAFSTSSRVPSFSPELNGTSNSRNSSSSVEELDALMESLNASSRSSRRASTKPAVMASPPEPSPPVVVKQPTLSSPTTTTTYNSNNSRTPSTIVSPPVISPLSSNRDSFPMDPPRGGGGDDLDSLLQNLTNQMSTIDNENPSSRGTCGTCKHAILGEIIQAMGKTYHPEHFVCGSCKQVLGTRNFYEQNGMPHCERCFQELYCPKCAHCDKPVLDRCITALGKKWHVEHFICTQCLKPFAGGNFFERDGRPYCEADFYGLFAPKCANCHEAIKGDCINALGSQWHSEHFVCSYCQKSFSGGVFFEHSGKPFCEIHYHQQTGSLCSGCGKPITGRCVNALDKKWHPEHFVCAFCMNPLAGGSFTEHNSKAYCRECHGKLFGN